MSTVDNLKYAFDVGARANRFDVRFFLPPMFGHTKRHDFIEQKVDNDEVSETSYETKLEPVPPQNYMGIRVESCSLPGRSVGTTGWSEYGAERQMPDGSVDDGGTIDFTFICDQSFADRLIIEAWLALIYSGSKNSLDVESGGDRYGAVKETNPELTKRGMTHDGHANQEFPHMVWYDDYKSTIQVIQHRIDRKSENDEKRNALEYTLHEAYPISFDSQTLSMDESGIMKFSCTFAYRFWESRYRKAPKRSFLNKGRVLLDALLDGSNLLSRFGKEGKVRKTLNNLDTRTSQISNIFGGG